MRFSASLTTSTTMGDVRSVVIGAGAAGLIAARDLLARGDAVTVLEARDRIGGRVTSLELDGLELDAGAESFATRGGAVAALASVAGLLWMTYYGVVSFSDGFVPGVKAFTAAVLGGIGSLPGAVLGGLLIGLIETFWSAYFTIDYKDVAAFSILAVVLIFLPSGLLGRPDVEKV